MQRTTPFYARSRAGSLAMLLVLVAMLACAGCTAHSQPPASRPTPVRVQTATSGPASPSLSTHGIVAAKDELRLSFKVGGVIRAITVEEGQQVSRGEKLAEIELTEVDAQVQQARALQEKAQRDLARGERLYADDVISLEQLQDLRTQASIQQATLASAQFNRGYAVITAPQDGVVLRKLSKEREQVPAGQPVIVVSARKRGYVVKAALSDRDVVQLKLGDPAQIRMDAFPTRTIAGRVSEIANAADEKNGLFPIEVSFDDLPVTLASGLVARLHVYPASSRAGALTHVPLSAIVEGDADRASVFVVEGNQVKRRQVHVAFIESSGVALSSGLQIGERIVTDGALYLEDNDRITVVQDAAKVVGNATAGAG